MVANLPTARQQTHINQARRQQHDVYQFLKRMEYAGVFMRVSGAHVYFDVHENLNLADEWPVKLMYYSEVA